MNQSTRGRPLRTASAWHKAWLKVETLLLEEQRYVAREKAPCLSSSLRTLRMRVMLLGKYTHSFLGWGTTIPSVGGGHEPQALEDVCAHMISVGPHDFGQLHWSGACGLSEG
jgi:hypothetical protein